MQIPNRTISLVETVRSEQSGGKVALDGGQDLSFSTPRDETGEQRVAASLIIGLNVASADSDESSGFECSLWYVTVIVAGQLTN